MGHHSTATRLITVFLVIGGLADSIPAVETRENLLLNGDIEKGKNDRPSIWFAAHVPADGLRMARVSDVRHAGNHALMIENSYRYEEPTSNNWSQELQVTPVGRAIACSAYIRAEGADSINVCIQAWDITGKKLLAFTSTPVVRGDAPWRRLRSRPVVVPEGAASITVRAVLTGTGRAWFDDISVESVNATRIASQAPAQTLTPEALPPDLIRSFDGRIVRGVPLKQDCMIVAYLPKWAHGNVDNIAVANNSGGVRTMVQWDGSSIADGENPERRFILAMYSRRTTMTGERSKIGAYPIQADWQERTSWIGKPKTTKQPVQTYEFVAGEGWKLFDVTTYVRSGFAGRRKRDYGLLLRFEDESRSIENKDWSGYAFVSREGEGEWRAMRPLLLVVDPR